MRAIFILALLTACQRLPPADSGSPYVSPSETGTEQINTDTGTDNGMPECMGNGEDFCCPINELVGTPFYIEGMEEKAPKETPFQRTCIPEFCHSTSYPMKVHENLDSVTWVYYARFLIYMDAGSPWMNAWKWRKPTKIVLTLSITTPGFPTVNQDQEI